MSRQHGDMPSASQFFPPVDGLADAGGPSFTGNWKQVTPSSAPVLFAGTSSQVDYLLPPEFGKCTDFLLHFPSITVVNSSAVQTGVLAPTPYWVNSIEHWIGGDSKETVTSHGLFAESVTFQTDQEYDQIYSNLSMNSASKTVSSVTGASIAIYNTITGPANASTVVSNVENGNNGYWLPITGLFSSIQPFVAGFTETLKLRVNFAGSINPTVGWSSLANAQTALTNFANGTLGSGTLAAGGGTTGVGASTLKLTCPSQVNLWVKEASLPPKIHESLVKLHKSGVQYRGLRRVTWSGQAFSAPTTVASQITRDDQLTSITGNSAALYFYLKPDTQTIEDSLLRLPISIGTVKDSSKNSLSPAMPAALIENWVSPSATPLSSYFVNCPTFTSYIFPFSSSLMRSNFGKKLGGKQLGGHEYVSYTPTILTYSGSATIAPTTVTPNVISYDYVRVIVKDGKAVLDREGEDA